MKDNDDILIAEDWWLKPSLLPTSVWSYDKGKNGGYVADFEKVGRDIRLIGTKKQIREWWRKTGVEIKDIWHTELTEQHKELYERNCKKLVVIRLG